MILLSPSNVFSLSLSLSPLSQVWESVPFLVSYQSSVIKEKASISTYPDESIRTWKGNSFLLLSRTLSSVLDSCLWSLHAALRRWLPPCLLAPQSVCLSIFGNVLLFVCSASTLKYWGRLFQIASVSFFFFPPPFPSFVSQICLCI